MPNDITEDFQIDLVNTASSKQYTNSGYVYDLAIDNQPFFDASSPERPYRRETAQYRKDQQDNSSEPGEQSLTGWWLRSQSSFHYGSGIRFYEPTQDLKLRFRFADSQGLNVWEQGQVTLLRDVASAHTVTSTNRTPMRSIKYSTKNAVLLHDEYDVDKIEEDGTTVHFIDYNSGTDYAVDAICDDGVTAYWITNVLSSGTPRLHVYKKALTGDSTTSNTLMFNTNSITVTSAVMDWVKGRIIACVNNKVYELTSASTTLPTEIFAAPTGFVFTDITASASDIYLSGYLGESSMIYRLGLDADGTFTSLSAGVVVAEMPRGEIVWSIECYLGYMAIGTSKGVRIAAIQDGGGIVYGPLLFETSQPCYQFAVRDRFVWAACGVGSDAGLVRIDLGTQVDTLRFAYANDVQAVGVVRTTGGCAFMNGTDRIAFTSLHKTTDGSVYIEASSTLRSSGYLLTGRIRFNTTEDKYFKYVKERANYDDGGSIIIGTANVDIVTAQGSYSNQDIAIPESDPSEYKQFKFTLQRSSTDSSKGPVFNGYQIKALPATRRQHLIQYHVYMFDGESDRFGNVIRKTGRAFSRLLDLETLEGSSNIVRVEDFRTGEAFDALIEQVQFTSTTAPNKKFSGFGGIVALTVRKL